MRKEEEKKNQPLLGVFTQVPLFMHIGLFLYVMCILRGFLLLVFFFIFLFLKGGREVGFSPSKEDDEKIIIVANNY